MRTPAILLALVLLPAFAGLAAAQTPSAAPSVDISAEAAEGKVTVEGARTFHFTVKNTSPASSSPADAQDKADIVIRVAGIPAGWTASTPPSFQLAPGASQGIDIQVSVATGSPKETVLTVSADIYSPLKGLDPLLGSVPGATQKATDSATIHLATENSATRNVIEAVGPWIYAILLLLVAAVLVAVAITVSSRRTLVRLASETRELPVHPGGRVAFPFRAEGLARDQDTVLLQVSAVQEGWAAFLPVPELVLDPGQPQDLTLTVIAPHTAAQGTRQAILVTATSAKAPKGAANVEFVAIVQGPEELPAASRRSKA